MAFSISLFEKHAELSRILECKPFASALIFKLC